MRPFACTVLLVAAMAATAAAQFEPLLAKLPRESNLLVMIQAEKLLSSELATAKGWKQKYEENYAQAPLSLPPEAVLYAAGSRLDLPTLTPVYEAAVMTFHDDLPIAAVARIVRGEQDNLAGVQAVRSPKGAYILKLAEAEYGVMRPADRQRTARWAREARFRESAELSPYLTAAAQYPDRVGTEIIFAIDLTDAVGREAVRRAMAASPVVSDAGVDPTVAAAVLSSVRGMTLGVRVTDGAYGSLRVDFAGPIGPIEPVAKDLLIEVLEEAGVAIDALYDWRPQTAEKGFRLSGELDAAGLRQVLSFLEVDASGVAAGDAESSDEDGPRVDRYVTKDYFDGVKKLLRDLKLETGAKSYYTQAHWFEKYAAAIDRLPILGVDPELVDYGKRIVGELRDAALAIRGVGVRTGGRSAGVQGTADDGGYGYSGSYNVFSGSVYEQGKSGVRDAEAQRRAIRGEERARGSQDVQSIVRGIQEETSAIRRRMTEKHGVEF